MEAAVGDVDNVNDDENEDCYCSEPAGGCLCDSQAGGALADLEDANGYFADAPMDPVGNDDDSDDGSDGNFVAYEQVTKGRRVNFLKSDSGSSGSGSPSTATCNFSRH